MSNNAQSSGRIKAGTFDLDANTLRQIVTYDEQIGHLVWQHTHGKRVRGCCVGSEGNRRGDLKVCIGGKRYFQHRLIWLYVHGVWPNGFIDHIDGDPKNNRIENLREASCTENLWNTRRSRKNTSGYKGVSWDRKTCSWRAYVTANGKTHWLGNFQTKEAAFAARVATADKLHGEFARHA